MLSWASGGQGPKSPDLAITIETSSAKVTFVPKASGCEVALFVLLGCMIESSLGISAAAQLAPLADYADLDGHLLITNDPFSGIMVDAGKLTLGKKPGLGVEEFDECF